MSILSWFKGNNAERDNDVVVKILNSKGVSKFPVVVTVGDIKRGIAIDSQGYPNEVVLFLRLNKKDR